MDSNYNLMKLENLLDDLLKDIKIKDGNEKIKSVIYHFLNERVYDELQNHEIYSYNLKTIKLCIEKKLLLSLENKYLNVRKSFWDVLKQKELSPQLLLHYLEPYIESLTNKVQQFSSRTVNEIIEKYNSLIKESMNIEKLNEIIENTESVRLDHMNNLNANGRVISTSNGEETVKLGGMFLSKDSKVGYGKFVNKEKLINNLVKLKNNSLDGNIKIGNSQIHIDKIIEIANFTNQAIKFDTKQNVKNNIKEISLGHAGLKQAGNLFLGKKDIDLQDGVYVSAEEITLAINKIINQKQSPKKVVKRLGVFKKFASITALVGTLIASGISLNNSKGTIELAVTQSLSNFSDEDNDKAMTTIIENVNEVVTIENKFEPIKEDMEENKTISKVIVPVSNETEINLNIKNEGSEQTKFEPIKDEFEESINVDNNMINIQQNLVNSVDDYVEGQFFTAKPYSEYNELAYNTLCAVIGGEDNGTFEGALAVASTMCNRADINGTTPLEEAISGAYHAYGGEWYNNHINGEIPDYIKNAVNTALVGTRNTTATSFDGVEKEGRIKIGGNYYYNFLGENVMVVNNENIKTM